MTVWSISIYNYRKARKNETRCGDCECRSGRVCRMSGYDVKVGHTCDYVGGRSGEELGGVLMEKVR